MARLFAVPVVALLSMSACEIFPKGECASGAVRCNGNTLQDCHATEFLGPTSWNDKQACISPQVCRTDTAGPAVDLGEIENGCFDPNAYCPGEGATTCSGAALDSSLWSCVLHSADQTLRWAMTNCSGLVPQATCLWGPSNAAACYEIVQNCRVADNHCDGSILWTCSGPNLVNDKAVFDWETVDCAQGGQVCRVHPTFGVGCYPP